MRKKFYTQTFKLAVYLRIRISNEITQICTRKHSLCGVDWVWKFLWGSKMNRFKWFRYLRNIIAPKSIQRMTKWVKLWSEMMSWLNVGKKAHPFHSCCQLSLRVVDSQSASLWGYQNLQRVKYKNELERNDFSKVSVRFRDCAPCNSSKPNEKKCSIL